MIKTTPRLQKHHKIKNLPKQCPCQVCIIKPICEKGCEDRYEFENEFLGIRYVERCPINI